VPRRDGNGNAIIVNPEDPPAGQRYDLQRLANVSGTVLPTIGITVDF